MPGRGQANKKCYSSSPNFPSTSPHSASSASAKFVQLTEQFDASVTVTRNQESVGGTSIMGLMMLAAGPGSTIRISAEGNQAAEALEALCGLVEGRFGEEE